MFSVKERERIRDGVLQMAASDKRVVAGAVVGSFALDDGDRWSDLDLTFAVANNIPIHDVLEDWTRQLNDEFSAVKLFDLPSGVTIYRFYFCFPAACSSTSPSLPRPNLEPMGQNLGCFLAVPWKNHTLNHHRRRSSSAMRCITHCGHAFASSGAVTGRRSTGSVESATTRLASPVVAVVSQQAMAGASMNYLVKWAMP